MKDGNVANVGVNNLVGGRHRFEGVVVDDDGGNKCRIGNRRCGGIGFGGSSLCCRLLCPRPVSSFWFGRHVILEVGHAVGVGGHGTVEVGLVDGGHGTLEVGLADGGHGTLEVGHALMVLEHGPGKVRLAVGGDNGCRNGGAPGFVWPGCGPGWVSAIVGKLRQVRLDAIGADQGLLSCVVFVEPQPLVLRVPALHPSVSCRHCP